MPSIPKPFTGAVPKVIRIIRLPRRNPKYRKKPFHNGRAFLWAHALVRQIVSANLEQFPRFYADHIVMLWPCTQKMCKERANGDDMGMVRTEICCRSFRN